MFHSISSSSLGFPAIDLKVLKDPVFDPQIKDPQLAIQMIPNLNTNQKSVFDNICKRILKNKITINAFFITGTGGCGKTYLYEIFLHFFHGKRIKYSAAEWAGIAAMLLLGGRTSHNIFKFSIPILENSINSIILRSKA